MADSHDGTLGGQLKAALEAGGPETALPICHTVAVPLTTATAEQFDGLTISRVTDKPRICAIRDRITRNLLATLAFSQGVPMLTQGDEMGRTQGGNNNAYCQDNPISWVRWKLDACDRSLLDFTRMIFRWRRENSAFHLAHFMEGEEVGTSGLHDVTWLLLNGGEMTASDWHDKKNCVLGMLVNGAASDEVNAFAQQYPYR